MVLFPIYSQIIFMIVFYTQIYPLYAYLCDFPLCLSLLVLVFNVCVLTSDVCQWDVPRCFYLSRYLFLLLSLSSVLTCCIFCMVC